MNITKRIITTLMSIAFGFYLLINSIQHDQITLLEDGLGGRLPTSDSADWVIGSNQAFSKYEPNTADLTIFVSRRPINVGFNALIYKAASLDSSSDALYKSLAIKRFLAITAIVLLGINLRALISPISNFLISIGLAAVLFHDPSSTSELNGYSAVGYSHLTSLNAFIFVALSSALTIPVLVDYQKKELTYGSLRQSFHLGCAYYLLGY